LRILPLVLFGLILVHQRPSDSSSRPIVVIGDLHMCIGRAGSTWHPYEDFRWRDEFVRFLDAIQTDGSGNTDLVINGDLFELLQSATVACAHQNPSIGCSTDEALQRLETVVSAHAEELKAIGRFATAGSNRVHIIPGDHDAALLIPAVWRRVSDAIGAPTDRISLAADGGWLSPDGRVYVEHGHQLPMSADRFSGWPRPVVAVNGRSYLERPWGEQVLLPLYNRTEAHYPIVDNIVEEGVGAKHVGAALGVESPEGVASLLRLFLTKRTWQQFRQDLDDGNVQAPAWDIKQIRFDTAAFLAGSLPSDDPYSCLREKNRHLRVFAPSAARYLTQR
jgi:hypothetical protein